MRQCWLWGVILALSGCADRYTMAPVVGPNWQAYQQGSYRYRVQRGDTLYAIAFRYDRDYRQLAALNNLHSPYLLSIGQTLIIRMPSALGHKSTKQPFRKVTRPTLPHQFKQPVRYSGLWKWPAQGQLISKFVPQQGKKGIEIAGRKAAKIYASRNGVVAYAGNGLPGYGNLIILIHDNQFLTAYGNNARNLVKEGQRVQSGQVIAEMGIIDHRFYGVHFEIRQAGHPLNPLDFLHNL